MEAPVKIKNGRYHSPLFFPVGLPRTSLPSSILDSYMPTCQKMVPLVLIVSPLPFYRRRPTNSLLFYSTILLISFLLIFCVYIYLQAFLLPIFCVVMLLLLLV